MTTSDNVSPQEAAYKMNISNEEKKEMLKSFGNQPGPEPRELSLVDEGEDEEQNFDFAHPIMTVGSSLSRNNHKLKKKSSGGGQPRNLKDEKTTEKTKT